MQTTLREQEANGQRGDPTFSTDAVRTCPPSHPSSAVVPRADGTCEAASPSQTGAGTFRSQSVLPPAVNHRPGRGREGPSPPSVCLVSLPPTAACDMPHRGACARRIEVGARDVALQTVTSSWGTRRPGRRPATAPRGFVRAESPTRGVRSCAEHIATYNTGRPFSLRQHRAAGLVVSRRRPLGSSAGAVI